MKKLLSLLAVALIYAGLNAQTPVAATQDFNQRYNNVQASWASEGNYWVASFQANNELQQAFYLHDGTWAGTETPSQLTQMSAPAQDFVNTRFIQAQNGYTFVKAVNRQETEKNYHVAYLSMDSGRTLKLFFDTEGQLVRREISQ